MSTTESSEWSFGWGNFGNPLEKLFGKEDTVEEEDPSISLKRATTVLVICYSIIDSLIITSNLLTLLMIVFTRLRYSLFHLKILICSIGDIIFGVVLAFAVLELKDHRHAWYYGDVFCYITKYISATHLIFISFSLCALICDQIIKETIQHKVAVSCIHVFLLTLPFVATYLVAVPVLVSNDIVTITNLTDTDKKDYTFCRYSQDYESHKIIAVSILGVMHNTIFLPFIIILSIALISRRKRRHPTNTSEAMNDASIKSGSNERSSCYANMSSGMVVIIITIVAVFCTIPNCVLHFCSPDCLNEDTMYSVPHYLYMLCLVPSIVRPYLWLMDKKMRQVAARICCFICRKNQLT